MNNKKVNTMSLAHNIEKYLKEYTSFLPNIYRDNVTMAERGKLPVSGIGNYRVENGKVYTDKLEINIANHCNLSCRGCAHAAPTVKKDFLDVAIIRRDLERLSKFFRCRYLRILGGEPLLNPNLKDIILVGKESGICDKIQVVTNGVLLPKLSEDVIDLIDDMDISYYDCKQTQKVKETASQISQKHKNTRVRVTPVEYFRESLALKPTDNESLTQLIYDTCQLAHAWRCITLDKGYLFRCPQQMGYAKYTKDYSEALSLNNIESVNDILNFLELITPPLYACRSCLGSVGEAFKHEMVKKNEFVKFMPKTVEEAVNWGSVKKMKNYFETQNNWEQRKIKNRIITKIKIMIHKLVGKVKFVLGNKN